MEVLRTHIWFQTEMPKAAESNSQKENQLVLIFIQVHSIRSKLINRNL